MNYQELTMREIDIYQKNSEYNSKELNDYIFQCNIHDLYSKAVGDIGLDPKTFWDMTLDELELAYKGYLTRLEILLNGFRLAQLAPEEDINLYPRDFSVGTVEQQQYTLHLFRETLK